MLNRKSRRSGIAPLKRVDGTPVIEPQSKAQLFADTFANKHVFAPFVVHSHVADPVAILECRHFIRSRAALKVLQRVDVCSATGPGGLPGRILKECMHVLAPIFARIAAPHITGR